MLLPQYHQGTFAPPLINQHLYVSYQPPTFGRFGREKMRLQVQIGTECIVVPYEEEETVHEIALKAVAKIRRLRPRLLSSKADIPYHEVRRTVGNSLLDPEDKAGDVLKDGDSVILVVHQNETEEEKEKQRQVELETARITLKTLDKPRRIRFDFEPPMDFPQIEKPTKLLVLDGESLLPADLVQCERGECIIQVANSLD
ncbi:hypothetical protein KIN20_010132 [Parelaphostrongylus tenuis]|uniref:Par3/HAL N-terminal domain-containing protein n=1 Tax=Parelaphostrongylus tenuis TaxID=148309 RepID=A0AAD5MTI3_PARTN|nr:hypothetical protein KIN20_010132 [Parelaphostrongylus tenuis]